MTHVTLTLLNHHFDVPCTEEDRPTLIQAATLLEDKLDQVPHLKGENKVLMVALNLCYDYIRLRQDTLNYSNHLEEQLEALMSAVMQQDSTAATDTNSPENP
jgi:cell division protein ZapA